jgi:RNase P subunit RPR2
MEVIMARAEQKENVGQMKSQSAFSSARLHSSCLRCGGFIVKELSADLLNSAGELECVTTRCVQCGDILDPVILRNRGIRQQPMTVQHAGNSLRSISSMEHR